MRQRQAPPRERDKQASNREISRVHEPPLRAELNRAPGGFPDVARYATSSTPFATLARVVGLRLSDNTKAAPAGRAQEMSARVRLRDTQVVA